MSALSAIGRTPVCWHRKAWPCLVAKDLQYARRWPLDHGDIAGEALAPAWNDHFRNPGTEGLAVARADDLLDIMWPESANGVSADMDFILAATTKPVIVPPGGHSVADALRGQSGGCDDEGPFVTMRSFVPKSSVTPVHSAALQRNVLHTNSKLTQLLPRHRAASTGSDFIQEIRRLSVTTTSALPQDFAVRWHCLIPCDPCAPR